MHTIKNTRGDKWFSFLFKIDWYLASSLYYLLMYTLA